MCVVATHSKDYVMSRSISFAVFRMDVAQSWQPRVLEALHKDAFAKAHALKISFREVNKLPKLSPVLAPSIKL